MQKIAHFYFYGSLNDFLRPNNQHKILEYKFSDAPAIKDAIEAIGIPHPEVDVILVNDQPVPFYYSLSHFDNVKVYPAHFIKGYEQQSLTIKLSANKFVLDVHLGKLAGEMRMLGFDTVYQNNYDDVTIASIAKEQDRVVLTRDINLLKHKIIQSGYWLRSQITEKQLAEVINKFDLAENINPFTRCIACNGLISPIDKSSVIGKVPVEAERYFNDFFQCNNCKRIYWKGSHYDRMLGKIKKLESYFKK